MAFIRSVEYFIRVTELDIRHICDPGLDRRRRMRNYGWCIYLRHKCRFEPFVSIVPSAVGSACCGRSPASLCCDLDAAFVTWSRASWTDRYSVSVVALEYFFLHSDILFPTFSGRGFGKNFLKCEVLRINGKINTISVDKRHHAAKLIFFVEKRTIDSNHVQRKFSFLLSIT